MSRKGWRRFVPSESLWKKLNIIFGFLTQYGWLLLMLILHSIDPKAPRYDDLPRKDAIVRNMTRMK